MGPAGRVGQQLSSTDLEHETVNKGSFSLDPRLASQLAKKGGRIENNGLSKKGNAHPAACIHQTQDCFLKGHIQVGIVAPQPVCPSVKIYKVGQVKKVEYQCKCRSNPSSSVRCSLDVHNVRILTLRSRLPMSFQTKLVFFQGAPNKHIV